MAEPGVTALQRHLVMQRARECCEYCRSQARFSPDPFSVEHILPRVRGGVSEPTNLALACQGCNNRKYTAIDAIDPVTGETVALFHPRQERWQDHFTWNEDHSLMLGLTPIGRATVEKLQLNRAALVSLRRVLRSVGEHPPRE